MGRQPGRWVGLARANQSSFEGSALMNACCTITVYHCREITVSRNHSALQAPCKSLLRNLKYISRHDSLQRFLGLSQPKCRWLGPSVGLFLRVVGEASQLQ